MNKDYVAQYVKLEKEHWWFQVRQKIIIAFLKKYVHRPSSILNIGAAGGASSEWLSALGNVTSLESDLYFIEHLQQQKINVINASVLAMPFADNSFDVICAFDVIEHVKDDIAAMNEMKRICKPGGIICVTVPAFKMLWSQHDVINGHFRRYTRRMLNDMGHSSELEKYGIKYFNSFLFLPILVARKAVNLLPKKNREIQSDFASFEKIGFLDKILKGIFSAEIPLLKMISFPVGVSLIAAWRKPDK